MPHYHKGSDLTHLHQASSNLSLHTFHTFHLVLSDQSPLNLGPLIGGGG